mmetsp:Transcript_61966/g.98130  ORF Transcript_61966/g.98130 Transcript_61966/m.98130 type:complete len:523 (-) Transcript_61966:186-1754(-)
MGGAILSDSNGIMGSDEDGACLRECGNSNGATHVIGEDGESGAVRDHACLVKRERIGHCSHAELADAKAHVALGIAVFQEVTSALHQGHVGRCQVSGTTHELWQHVGNGVEAVLRVKTCCLALVLWGNLRQGFIPVLRQLAINHGALELRGKLRLLLLVLLPHLLPGCLLLSTCLCMLAEGVIHLLWHLELSVVPAQLLASGLSLICTEGCTMGIMAVSLVGRAEADGGLHLDQSWLVSASLGLLDGLADGIHIGVALRHFQDLPSIALKALADILSEGEIGVSIDGDAVVIVESNQLSQTQVASICASFVRNSLLHASITCNGVGVVVDQLHARFVVNCCKVGFSGRQANRVGDTHAKGSGGHFNALGLEVLWVAGSLGTPLSELLDVIDGDALVASQMQQRVLEHATVARRKNKTVTIHPLWILRIVLHLFCKEKVSDRCLTHGSTRVATVGLVHCIHSQEADGVDALSVDINFSCCGHANDLLLLRTSLGWANSCCSCQCRCTRTNHAGTCTDSAGRCS